VACVCVCNSSADELTREKINAADVQIPETRQKRDGDDAADAGGLAEAKLWSAARLLAAANVDAAELMRQWEAVGRARRSTNDLWVRQRKPDDHDNIDITRRHMLDYEDSFRKRPKRPPVDPTLLMMGIGRRK